MNLQFICVIYSALAYEYKGCWHYWQAFELTKTCWDMCNKLRCVKMWNVKKNVKKKMIHTVYLKLWWDFLTFYSLYDNYCLWPSLRNSANVFRDLLFSITCCKNKTLKFWILTESWVRSCQKIEIHVWKNTFSVFMQNIDTYSQII